MGRVWGEEEKGAAHPRRARGDLQRVRAKVRQRRAQANRTHTPRLAAKGGGCTCGAG